MRGLPISLRRPLRFPGRQDGAVLMMAMLIVVLILMAGITATSNSNAQLKLAGIFQSEDDALNNAESAMAQAENWLRSGSNYLSVGFAEYDAQATPRLLPIGYLDSQPAAGPAPRARPALPWPPSDVAASAAGAGGDPAQVYIIEQLSRGARLPGSSQVVGGRNSTGCNQVNTYEITARGRDPRGTFKVIQADVSILHCPD